MRHAIVRNGIVENVIEWDGTAEWTPPSGALILATAAASVGWTYDGTTLSAPLVPLPLLAEQKAAKRARVSEAFTARQVAGMPYGGKFVQLRIAQDDIGNITGAADLAKEALAGNMIWPAGFAWRTRDNSLLPLDAAGMKAMAIAAEQFFYAMRINYWAKVDAIATATDQAALDAIDPTTGWPS